MKKKIVSLLCAVLVLGIVGCGADNKEQDNKDNTKVEQNDSENDADDEDDSDDNEASGETPGAGDYSQDTLGGQLVALFTSEISDGADLTAVATTLSAVDVTGYDCAVTEYQPGYLPGFSEDVTGFNQAVGFMPWIGSVPFVGYIFETDDPEGFLENLINIADPRWNICTEAAETVYTISGNYVFFSMCPGEEDF